MDYERLTHEAVQLLCRLIETPRVSREEGEAASVLEAWMRGQGMNPDRHGNNLVARSPRNAEGKPVLLLNAHIDTVKPTSAWTVDPHKPLLEGDRLTGLGSNDDGASLVSLLQAFRILSQQEQPYNLVLALSAEEEVSGKNGMEALVPLLGKVDVALVGEPTGMQPAVAERGLMVVDVTCQGRAGHAARDEGDNAIYHAVDDLQWIRSFRFPQVSDVLGPVKMSVTIINAGTQHNVVPAECVYTIDVRSNGLYGNEQIFATLQEHLQGEPRARSFRLQSSRIEESHPLVQRALQLGRRPFGSPTLSDQALMPWTSMKMGPGQSSRSHAANEFILVSEIREAIEVYCQLLEGLVITS